LFLATFTYGRGIGGRQLRGQPLPDHGKQEYDDNFRGGNFATPHPQYYRHTSIAPERAPDHPDYDVVADVLPAAHRRGMKVICWFEDVFRPDVPGFDEAAEIDLHGKPTGLTCHRNPNARSFWLGLAEDYLRSYDVDGLMWGSERQGPLDNALGASHGSSSAGGVIACFCPHCLAAAQQGGINIERAREGYLALERWAAARAVRAEHPRNAVRRLDTRADPGLHLRRAAIPPAAARSHRRAGPLGRLRAPRDAARRGRRRTAPQDLAGDRHRHPHWGEREEDPTRRRVSGGAGGVPGWRPRRPTVPEVL